MKAGTLTFHRACNYGAILQTYALVKVLNTLGVEAEVIDYRPEFNEKRFAKKKLESYFQLRQIYGIIFSNSIQRFNITDFRKFMQERIPHSHTIVTTPKECEKITSNYDFLISGSDQIWNLSCTDGDDTYFLPFTKREGQKKIAYAASIGKTQFSEQEEKHLLPLIKDFDCISIREYHGAQLLQSLGLKGVEVTADPTLLLNKDEWKEIADYTRVPDKEYLVLYMMSEDMNLAALAKRYAAQRGLKVVYINHRVINRIRGVIRIKDATPEQWIGLFLKSDTIFTNSFHGTAFGINFGKPVHVKLIQNSPSNSRMQSLLEILGGEECIIKDMEDIGSEFICTEHMIDKLRNTSMNFLKNAINAQN